MVELPRGGSGARSGSPRPATDPLRTLAQSLPTPPPRVSASRRGRGPEGRLPGRVQRACARVRPPPAYAPSPDSSSFLSNFFSMVVPAGREAAALWQTRAASGSDPGAAPHRPLPASHVVSRSAHAQSALRARAQPGATPGFNPLPAGEEQGSGPGVAGEGRGLGLGADVYPSRAPYVLLICAMGAIVPPSLRCGVSLNGLPKVRPLVSSYYCHFREALLSVSQPRRIRLPSSNHHLTHCFFTLLNSLSFTHHRG